MKPEHLELRGEGYIDYIDLMHDTRFDRKRLLVTRVYDRIKEGLDLKAGEPWVRLRQALQGGQVL